MIKIKKILPKKTKNKIDAFWEITQLNIQVFEWVKDHLNKKYWSEKQYTVFIQNYLQLMIDSYEKEDINTILNALDVDSNEINKDMYSTDNDKFIKCICTSIGACSDLTTNYTLTERFIMIIAAAKRMNIKFDFS